MLCTYALKAFSEHLDALKVDDDYITPMEKFSGTITDISLENQHTRGCPLYVLYARFQDNRSGLHKC